MTLQEQIKKDLTTAMKNKDQIRVSVLRNIISEITNTLVANNQTPQDTLDNEHVQQVIERLAKQRKESIAQYEANNRTEQAEAEKAELDALETYLPEKMSEEDITAIVKKKIDELSITDSSQMGALMGPLMKELQGKADGTVVKKIVTDLLS